MLQDGKIWVGTSENGPVWLLPSMSNRHGLIAGATGTGKTVSLKVLAESFSDMGVPVFLSDIKSDLSGMVKPGIRSEGIDKRLAGCGADPDASAAKASTSALPAAARIPTRLTTMPILPFSGTYTANRGIRSARPWSRWAPCC